MFKVKDKCEQRIQKHVKYQEELLKKLHAMNKISPDAYSIVNLSLEEIFKAMKEMHDDV